MDDIPVHYYGPVGRTVLLIDGASMNSTRDGQFILRSCRSQTQHLRKLLLKQILEYGLYHGDNATSIWIVTCHILGHSDNLLKLRVQSLWATEALLAATDDLRIFTKDCLISMGLLWCPGPDSGWRRALCSSVLTPATSAATSDSLCDILDQWLPMGSHASTLARLDRLLVLSAGELRSSYCLPSDQFILDAACKDFSALGPSTEPHTFLCIHHLFSAERNEDVRVSMAAEDAFSAEHERLRDARLFFSVMQSRGVSVCFIGDAVEEEVRFEAVQAGVIAVEAEAAALEHLATHCGLRLFLCVEEALDVGLHGDAVVGSFRKAQRESFLRPESFLRIYGLSVIAPPLCRQLVLRVASREVGALYKTLLRRCLATLRVAEEGGVCLSPGAGAMEMFWRRLLLRIRDALAASPPSDALDPLVERHAEALRSSGVDPQSLRAVLTLLAESYARCPQQLIENSACSHQQALYSDWCSRDDQMLGLVATASGSHLELRRSLDERVVGVYESFNAGFIQVLQSLRLFLRCGGEGGVTLVNRSVDG